MWPLNPEGELVVWAIVETKEGLANVREIAQVPGLSVLVAGRRHARRRVLDDQRRRPPRRATTRRGRRRFSRCSPPARNSRCRAAYPVSEADIETRFQQGFTVGILQSFNDGAFRALAKGRQISGRDKDK